MQLGMRASVDLQADHPAAAMALEEIQGWLDNRPFAEEIEERELATLGAPLGKLTPAQVVECSAEFEAAATLGWTLGFLPLPREDQVSPAQVVMEAFGLEDPQLLADRLESLRLRPVEEIHQHAHRLELFYQRLARHCFLAEGAPDPSHEHWLSQAFEVGLPLVAGDLCLHGTPLEQAPPHYVTRTLAALEPRFRALAWVLGDSLLYSRDQGRTAAQCLGQALRPAGSQP